MSDTNIPDQLRAYRAGDSQARDEVLGQVEGLLRHYVRGEMGAKLRSLEESIDLTQSLMLAFHMAASDGKIGVSNEPGLRAYLKSMVRHKIANRADMFSAQKRGGGKLPTSLTRDHLDDEASLPLPADDLTASVVFRVKETRERIEEHSSEEERTILEGRLLGRTDREIADDLGKSPDAVRMIWQRARARMVQQKILRDPR